MWRWFPSGPVIIVVEVERDLRYLCFSLYRIVARSAFNRKTMSKECVYADSRRQADVHIPLIHAIVYMPFGFSVRLRFDA